MQWACLPLCPPGTSQVNCCCNPPHLQYAQMSAHNLCYSTLIVSKCSNGSNGLIRPWPVFVTIAATPEPPCVMTHVARHVLRLCHMTSHVLLPMSCDVICHPVVSSHAYRTDQRDLPTDPHHHSISASIWVTSNVKSQSMMSSCNT